MPPKTPRQLSLDGFFLGDERLFSALNFIKSDLRNSLINPNLTNAVRMFVSDRFDLASFPYDEALDHWQGVKTRRSVGAQM